MRVVDVSITLEEKQRKLTDCARFDSTYTKIGKIQKSLACPLCKDDTCKFRKLSTFKKKKKR